jgi:DNA modification methylase
MPTLDWIGKKAVVNHHREVPYRLIHCDGELSAGNPDAGNLLVQGDNLEALKALLPYYAGKVKCIYIDPPYNTGNEGWVYNDNVNSAEMKAWLGKVVGKETEDLSRHDKWLCMMYPRLRLLRDFLRDDGMIFISIDANELAGLVFLMDEIFGPKNRKTIIANVNNPKGRSDDKYFATAHESLVVYGMEKCVVGGFEPEHHITKRYNKFDGNGLKYREIDLRKTGDNDRKVDRPNMFYPFYYDERTAEIRLHQKSSSDVAIYPMKSKAEEGRWRWSADTASNKLAQLSARYMPNKEQWSVFELDYLEGRSLVTPTTAWTGKQHNSERGSELLRELGFAKEDFDRPKPIGTIIDILTIATNQDDLILDSFAGSGTTGHAVLSVNSADGGNRRFILIEMDKPIAAKVTAERLKRAINGYDKLGDPKTRVEGLHSGFRFCSLGAPLFNDLGDIDVEVTFPDLAAHIFFSETGVPIPHRANENSSFIGTYKEKAVYLLFSAAEQGIAREAAGNVLTPDVLAQLPPVPEGFTGQRVVYGEGCTVSADRLKVEGVTFKQIPYQIEAN